jgi:hypothetical protein
MIFAEVYVTYVGLRGCGEAKILRGKKNMLK